MWTRMSPIYLKPLGSVPLSSGNMYVKHPYVSSRKVHSNSRVGEYGAARYSENILGMSQKLFSRMKDLSSATKTLMAAGFKGDF